MNSRTLLVMTILVALLGGYIFFFEKDTLSTDELAEREKKVLPLTVVPIQVKILFHKACPVQQLVLDECFLYRATSNNLSSKSIGCVRCANVVRCCRSRIALKDHRLLSTVGSSSYDFALV